MRGALWLLSLLWSTPLLAKGAPPARKAVKTSANSAPPIALPEPAAFPVAPSPSPALSLDLGDPDSGGGVFFHGLPQELAATACLPLAMTGNGGWVADCGDNSKHVFKSQGVPEQLLTDLRAAYARADVVRVFLGWAGDSWLIELHPKNGKGNQRWPHGLPAEITDWIAGLPPLDHIDAAVFLGPGSYAIVESGLGRMNLKAAGIRKDFESALKKVAANQTQIFRVAATPESWVVADISREYPSAGLPEGAAKVLQRYRLQRLETFDVVLGPKDTWSIVGDQLKPMAAIRTSELTKQVAFNPLFRFDAGTKLEVVSAHVAGDGKSIVLALTDIVPMNTGGRVFDTRQASRLGRIDGTSGAWRGDFKEFGSYQIFDSSTQLRISPDNSLLALPDPDSSSRLLFLDPSGGQDLATVDLGKKTLRLAFSPDSHCLAVVLEDGTVRLIDARTRNKMRDLGGHLVDVAFSADSKLVATAGGDNYLRLWETDSGKLVSTLTLPGPASAVAFSRTNLLAAVGDGHIHVFDLGTKKLRREIEDRNIYARSAVFTFDGKILLTAGNDVDAWDVVEGARITTLYQQKQGTAPAPRELFFSPDGKNILCVFDHFLQAWRISPVGPR